MIDTQFILGGVDAVLNSKAMALDLYEALDTASIRAPDGEEGEGAVSDIDGGSGAVASTDRIVLSDILKCQDRPVLNKPSRF
jgi:hypothetical protein